MTKYAIDPEQRQMLDQITILHAKMTRQRRALDLNKAALDELLVMAMKRGISTTRIGKAAGLSPSRVWQIVNDEEKAHG